MNCSSSGISDKFIFLDDVQYIKKSFINSSKSSSILELLKSNLIKLTIKMVLKKLIRNTTKLLDTLSVNGNPILLKSLEKLTKDENNRSEAVFEKTENT